MKVTVVVGARPNFMKAGPVLDQLCERGLEVTLVHTGQHYDERMSDSFLRELGFPEPQVALGVGSGSHGAQTAEVLRRFEAFLQERPQDLVVVVGDVNSTVAAALAAVKLHVPVAHVEAGLRSGDRRMPEEINRLITDSISSLLFVTEDSGLQNLRREGVEERRVHLVGNTMIDTLLRFRDRAAARPGPAGLEDGFTLVTLHRPSNVDHADTLSGILEVLGEMAEQAPICWPVHPRTQARLEEFDLLAELRARPGVHLLPPAGYQDFVGWMDRAGLILTDSGGIQEEALILRTPVVTLRENTERPVTVQCGGNLLSGPRPERIRTAVAEMRARDPASFGVPEGWDGRAAERVAERIQAFLEEGGWL